MAHEVSAGTSALVKAVGIMVGECVFGLFGPALFIPLLSWFEINLPAAIAVGVLVGAGVGYGLADAALRLYRRGVTAGRARRVFVLREHAGAHL